MSEHRYAGQPGGISLATHEIQLWLENEGPLFERARQIAGQDQRDGSNLLGDWVAFLLFGAPFGGHAHSLNSEPEHDARAVMDLKARVDRDDFRRIDWEFVRDSLLAE